MAERKAELNVLRAKAMDVYERLLATYGERPLTPRREPMHELISTILSHRTTGHNEDLAYRQMWEHFGSWDAIRDAPVADLAAAIAPSNFAEAKAPYMNGVAPKRSCISCPVSLS